MQSKQIFRILMLVVGLLIIYRLAIHVGIGEIVRSIRGANIGYLALGIFTYLMSLVIAGYKWFLLLRKENIRFSRFYPVYALNTLVSIVTPAKSADFIGGPYLFKRYLGLSAHKTFSVVAFDKIIELAVFILLVAASVVYLMLMGQGLPLKTFLAVITILGLVLVMLTLAVFRWEIIQKMLVKHHLFKKWETTHLKRLWAVGKSLKEVRRTKLLFLLITLTFIYWILQLTTSYYIINSIINVPFFLLISTMAITIAVGIASLIPLGIGSSTLTLSLLLSLFGYPVAATTSGWILSLAVLTAFVFFQGSVAYISLESRGGTHGK